MSENLKSLDAKLNSAYISLEREVLNLNKMVGSLIDDNIVLVKYAFPERNSKEEFFVKEFVDPVVELVRDYFSLLNAYNFHKEAPSVFKAHKIHLRLAEEIKSFYNKPSLLEGPAWHYMADVKLDYLNNSTRALNSEKGSLFLRNEYFHKTMKLLGSSQSILQIYLKDDFDHILDGFRID